MLRSPLRTRLLLACLTLPLAAATAAAQTLTPPIPWTHSLPEFQSDAVPHGPVLPSLPLPSTATATTVVAPEKSEFRFRSETRPAYGRMIGGGLLGGGAGALTGVLLGSGDIGSAVLGASAGATLGMPVGVHLGNGRRGNLFPSLIAAIGLSAGAAIYSNEKDFSNDAIPAAIAAPALSFAASMVIEAATMR